MKYTVVTGKNITEFISNVSKLLDEGWILQGGVAIEGDVYAQAVIRTSTMGDWERPEFRRETVYVHLRFDK